MIEQYTSLASDEGHKDVAGWTRYIIETEQGRLYTGIAIDLKRRFTQHKSGSGGAKLFRTDPPKRIVLTQDFSDRSADSKAEYDLKKLKYKDKLVLIERFLSGFEI